MAVAILVAVEESGVVVGADFTVVVFVVVLVVVVLYLSLLMMGM